MPNLRNVCLISNRRIPNRICITYMPRLYIERNHQMHALCASFEAPSAMLSVEIETVSRGECLSECTFTQHTHI